MRLISARQWFLVLLSAVLQIVIFPIAGPLPSWRAALCWIALVPLLVALLRAEPGKEPPTVTAAAIMGYVCGIVWYMGNCSWIFQTMHIYGGLPSPVAFLILILFSLYLGLYHALFAVIVVVIRRSSFDIRGSLLVAPFAWVTVELARSRITHFPWDLLGYTQVDNQFMAGMAALAGVMLMSFSIAAVNAAIVPFFLRSGWQRVTAPLIGIAFAFGLQLSNGDHTLRLIGNKYGSKTAVMMQENIEVGAVGRESDALSLNQELDQFSAASLHPSYAAKGRDGSTTWAPRQDSPQPSVIIWPEAPSHFMSSDPAFREAVGQLAQTAKSPVVAGSLGVDRSTIPARGYYLYDSASIFNAAGQYTARYDKIHLVPWGEYIPYKQFFSFADKLTEGVGDMDRGSQRKVFTIDGHKVGVFVCYESIFGDEIREFSQNGAEVLINISDDGWYGDSGAPWQHLNMVRMRAVENRRWILRATNTGITTAIDPRGQIAFEAPRHVRGAFAFPFDYVPSRTGGIYKKYGDWFAVICAFITAAFVLATRFKGLAPQWFRPSVV